MGRYETLRKCAQIKKLIDENKYIKALEIIESLDLRRNYAVSDLYLFADVYLKADRFDEARWVYYNIYERTHSKRVLKHLILLDLRLSEIKEAKELFLEYEMSAKPTLDLYEMRYRLAKAEGVSRNELIDILEDLHKEEFTEEWGFQLAKLYELSGERDKCIEVCKDIILWFGTGSIVNKAEELKAYCESRESLPVKEEDIPEPMEPDLTEEVPDVPDTPTEQANNTAEFSKKSSVKEPSLKKKEYIVDEENIYLSDNGFSYFTLRDTIMQLQSEEESPNFVITGGEERIVMAVVKKILKQLNTTGNYKTKNLAKITAEKLNQIILAERMDKLLGGCLLILDAQEISNEAKEQLAEVMEKHNKDFIVILSGEFDELDCWLGYHRDMESRFFYKVKL